MSFQGYKVAVMVRASRRKLRPAGCPRFAEIPKPGDSIEIDRGLGGRRVYRVMSRKLAELPSPIVAIVIALPVATKSTKS